MMQLFAACDQFALGEQAVTAWTSAGRFKHRKYCRRVPHVSQERASSASTAEGLTGLQLASRARREPGAITVTQGDGNEAAAHAAAARSQTKGDGGPPGRKSGRQLPSALVASAAVAGAISGDTARPAPAVFQPFATCPAQQLLPLGLDALHRHEVRGRHTMWPFALHSAADIVPCCWRTRLSDCFTTSALPRIHVVHARRGV